MDLYHLLSAVVGAFAGLVFYSAITPGHLPEEVVPEIRDPRLDLMIRDLSGRLAADGFFHVRGRLVNTRKAPCRRAVVGVGFTAGEKVLSKGIATIENIPADGSSNFEVRAYAPGATAFDTTVELAQF